MGSVMAVLAGIVIWKILPALMPPPQHLPPISEVPVMPSPRSWQAEAPPGLLKRPPPAPLNERLDPRLLCKHLAGLDIQNLNYAFVGRSGNGKSSLINALREVQPDDRGAARVGINECTRYPHPYPHPKFPRLVFHDMPGAGTQNVPSDGYVESYGFVCYDGVVLVMASRLTQIDFQIAHELSQLRIPFYFVRSKVDIDVQDNLDDYGISEEVTVQEIRSYLTSNISAQGFDVFQHPIFLATKRSLKRYDMPLLVTTMVADLEKIRPGI